MDQREGGIWNVGSPMTTHDNKVAWQMCYFHRVTQALGRDILPARLVGYSRWSAARRAPLPRARGGGWGDM